METAARMCGIVGILGREPVAAALVDALKRLEYRGYNPNTEDMKMLHAMRDEVLRVKADVALGFDGDGDRCGVVDNEGEEIFADKVGVMLARDISAQHPGATFVADVKSTGLFMTDPVLRGLARRPITGRPAIPT